MKKQSVLDQRRDKALQPLLVLNIGGVVCQQPLREELLEQTNPPEISLRHLSPLRPAKRYCDKTRLQLRSVHKRVSAVSVVFAERVNSPVLCQWHSKYLVSF